MITDLPTFVRADATAPEAYWAGWMTKVNEYNDAGSLWMLLVTQRTGETGRSDAQYTADRLASGLYAARVVEVESKRELSLDALMFISVGAEHGTYAVRVYSADQSESVKLPLGRISLDRAMRVADAIVDMLKKGWV